MSLLDVFKSSESENEPPQDDPIELLKQDHDKVRDLFKSYRALEEEEGGKREKRRLFSEINRELSIHTRIEEEVFYPAVKGADAEDSEKIVLEALEEHGVA